MRVNSATAYELMRMDATDQASVVRNGEVSAEELVEASILQIEKLNPALNAVIHPMFEKAQDQIATVHPGAPFAGVPFLVKDILCHTAGDPYHLGMQFLRRLDHHESSDSFLAARFRAAGFVFVGKTNTSELGLQVVTEPVAYGPTRNPWQPDHTPLGSSGGAAAAVASGMASVAHATDGGGSIRLPAAACGLVGLKPTRARVSLGPGIGEVVGGVAVEHVLTRSVRDSAAILDSTAGRMPGDPYSAPPPTDSFASNVGKAPGRLRIGVIGRLPDGPEVDSECLAALESTAKLLAGLGHEVEDSWPEGLADQAVGDDFMVLWCVIAAASLEGWSQTKGTKIRQQDVEPSTWALAERGHSITATALVAARERLIVNGRKQARWWERFDILVTPTMPQLPTRIGELTPSTEDPLENFARQLTIAAYTAPFNSTGQPALSIPAGRSASGLPIGVQVVADQYEEGSLIRLGSQLEQARPWPTVAPEPSGRG
ncbi:MAG: amidase [Chloroflexi bacterium]|nr:MAG: amidase [Chloroflexota bacterium]